MRERLGVAAAMLGDPPVLMFDEPFNGMDPGGDRVDARVPAFPGRAGARVLVSSHLMSELQDAADHLIVVGRGQVIADASVANLIAAASGDRVRLRTTARTEAMTVLARAGATVAVTGPDTATVSGLPADRIVALLTRSAIPFSEVSAHRATLEEAYMVRVTLTAMPRRTTMLAAKTGLLVGLVLVAGALAVAGSLLAGRLILPGHGFTPAHGFALLTPANATVLRAAAGSVLYLVLIALLSLGIATVVRDSAVAIGIVLALLYLFPIVANVVTNEQWHRHLEQIGPMTAGLAIQATTGLSSLPISPWAGLGVLAAWAGVALLAGGLVLRLRDA